ncbi:MAG: hypothetical protein ACRDQ7_23950 [Haloechinothrix sp.]
MSNADARRPYRGRRIDIEPPQLRAMTPDERKAADTALARLFAAMLADEDFLAAERRRQHHDQRPEHRRKDQGGGLTSDSESS